jgi:hypothetical protein
MGFRTGILLAEWADKVEENEPASGKYRISRSFFPSNFELSGPKIKEFAPIFSLFPLSPKFIQTLL